MRKIQAWVVSATLLCVVALVSTVPALAIGTVAGTNITNTATVAYKDVNGNNLSATSNTVTTTVSQVAAVDISPNNSSTADPGDVVSYPHTITNNGNGTDTIDVSFVSSQGWTVQIFADTNGNGVVDLGEPLLTDTDGDTTPDTGALAHDTNVKIVVRVTVPGGTADNTVDVTTLTATSSFNTSVSDTATDTTTVSAPSLTVTKSVAPLGNQPPGTVLTYTMVVTNGGTGTATNVVLSDAIPTNTTYVAGSITQDAAAKTDIVDGDNADHNGTTAGAVTVTIGSLASSASTTITFQVTIN